MRLQNSPQITIPDPPLMYTRSETVTPEIDSPYTYTIKAGNDVKRCEGCVVPVAAGHEPHLARSLAPPQSLNTNRSRPARAR